MQTPTPDSTSIKLQIDALSPRQFNIFFTIVLVALGTVFLLASNVPYAYSTEQRNLEGCSESFYKRLNYDCADFDLNGNATTSINITDVDASHKFLSLDLSLMKKYLTDPTTITAEIEISGFAESGQLFVKQRKTIEFDCSLSNGACNYERIANVGTLEDKNYFFVVKFLNNQELSKVVSDVYFTSTTLNLSFRNYIFAVKLIFVVCSVVGIFLLYLNVKDLRKEFRTSEQKRIIFIAPMLVTITEPFTVHILEGTMYTWSTTVSFVILSTSLTYFWLSKIDELAGSDSSLFEHSSQFAKIYSAVFFLTTTLAYLTLSTHGLRDPTFDKGSSGVFVVSSLAFIMNVVLLVGLIWSINKTVKIVQRLNEISDRDNTFFWFSAFFILCHFYLVYQGGPYPFTRMGTVRILYGGMALIYVIASGFLFLPTEEGLVQAQHLKKYNNPDTKNSYKDLEASVDHSAKKSPAIQQIQSPHEIPSSNQFTPNSDMAPRYPYENRDDDDL